MTTVTIDAKGRRIHIRAIGHAGDPEVCHGISALMFMAAGCMNNRSCTQYAQVLEDGMAVLDFETWSPALKEDIRAMTIGLLQIEQSHPDNIRVVQNIF